MTSPPPPLPQEPENPEDIVLRDRKDHPDCRYSSSISKACTSVNGNRTCETTRRILRACPGCRPEQIFEDVLRAGGSSTTSTNEATADGHPPEMYRGRLQPDPFFKRSGGNSSGGSVVDGGVGIPFPHHTPSLEGHPFDDIVSDFFADFFKPFRGVFDDSSIHLPSPAQAQSPPELSSVRPPVSHSPWKARVEIPTPSFPAPHKGVDQQQPESKWQKSSVVEQA
ncbi:unnamed protein product [Sphacelaria rigidula]